MTVTDGALAVGPQAATITFTNVNNAPVAHAGGPYTIAEGAGVMFDASGSSDAENDPLVYAWDLDNDGQYDDAVGVGPTLTWPQLQSLGIDDNGTYTIGLRVRDGNGGETFAATTLTVTNTPPTATNDGGAAFTTSEDVASITDTCSRTTATQPRATR